MILAEAEQYTHRLKPVVDLDRFRRIQLLRQIPKQSNTSHWCSMSMSQYRIITEWPKIA